MVEGERSVGNKTTVESRYYISNLPNDASVLLNAVRSQPSSLPHRHGINWRCFRRIAVSPSYFARASARWHTYRRGRSLW